MITLRKAVDRHHERRRNAWLTFSPGDRADPLANGFGALEALREGRFPPLGGCREPRQDVEIITYVREGMLAYDDSMGRAGVLRAGEFQRMTAGRGVRYGETNASLTDWSHVFQIWLRSSVAGLDPGQEQKRFSAAERRGALRVVASPDGRNGSLRVHQDAILHSAILDRGHHVIYEIAEGRRAWLHIVQGEAMLGAIALATGDGAGITAERAVSLTATDPMELLLLDLGPSASSARPVGGTT